MVHCANESKLKSALSTVLSYRVSGFVFSRMSYCVICFVMIYCVLFFIALCVLPCVANTCIKASYCKTNPTYFITSPNEHCTKTVLDGLLTFLFIKKMTTVFTLMEMRRSSFH